MKFRTHGSFHCHVWSLEDYIIHEYVTYVMLILMIFKIFMVFPHIFIVFLYTIPGDLAKDLFAKFFDLPETAVIQIPGRMFPVEIEHIALKVTVLGDSGILWESDTSLQFSKSF